MKKQIIFLLLLVNFANQVNCMDWFNKAKYKIKKLRSKKSSEHSKLINADHIHQTEEEQHNEKERANKELIYAASHNQTDKAIDIIDRYQNYFIIATYQLSVLHIAATQGNLPLVKKILNTAIATEKVNSKTSLSHLVDFQDMDGNTALMRAIYAAGRGLPEGINVVQELLACKPNLQLQNKEKKTAIQIVEELQESVIHGDSINPGPSSISNITPKRTQSYDNCQKLLHLLKNNE